MKSRPSIRGISALLAAVSLSAWCQPTKANGISIGSSEMTIELASFDVADRLTMSYTPGSDTANNVIAQMLINVGSKSTPWPSTPVVTPVITAPVVTPITGTGASLYGDADLNGIVTGTDFTILVENLAALDLTPSKGDFSYNGSVTGNDFTELVENLNQQSNGAAIMTSGISPVDYAAIDFFAAANGLTSGVPEPASMTLLICAGFGIILRRRRAI